MSLAVLCLGLVRSLPPSPGILLSRFLVLSYLLFRPDYRREISSNLALVCGRSSAWFWVRNGWYVGRNLALMALIGRRYGDALVDRAVIIGENNISGFLEQELHVTMASFHFGAWEYLPQLFSRRGCRVNLVVGVQRARKLARMLLKMRRSNQVRLARSLRESMRSLGRLGISGFMLDNTSRGRRVWPVQDSICFGMPGYPFKLDSGLAPAFAFFARGRLHVRVYEKGNESGALKALLEQVKLRPEEWIFWGKAGAVRPITDD